MTNNSLSLEELKNRLLNRGTDSLESIEGRLDIAKKEIKESHRYDYKVVNDDLNKAVDELEFIINNNINNK